MTIYRNDEILSLVSLAYQAHEKGDIDKMKEFLDQIDVKLEQRGTNPIEFWAGMAHLSKTWKEGSSGAAG